MLVNNMKLDISLNNNYFYLLIDEIGIEENVTIGALERSMDTIINISISI